MAQMGRPGIKPGKLEIKTSLIVLIFHTLFSLQFFRGEVALGRKGGKTGSPQFSGFSPGLGESQGPFDCRADLLGPIPSGWLQLQLSGCVAVGVLGSNPSLLSRETYLARSL